MTRVGASPGAILLSLALALPLTAQDETSHVSGTWELSWESARGPGGAVVILEQHGDSLSGTAEMRMGTVEISKASVDGDKVTFSIVLSREDRTVELVFSGEVDGDTFNGTMSNPRGDKTTFTGKRREET